MISCRDERNEMRCKVILLSSKIWLRKWINYRIQFKHSSPKVKASIIRNLGISTKEEIEKVRGKAKVKAKAKVLVKIIRIGTKPVTTARRKVIFDISAGLKNKMIRIKPRIIKMVMQMTLRIMVPIIKVKVVNKMKIKAKVKAEATDGD